MPWHSTVQPLPARWDPHEEGNARKKRDRGNENGDVNRRLPRQKPPNWKGPWPLAPDTTCTECWYVCGCELRPAATDHDGKVSDDEESTFMHNAN